MLEHMLDILPDTAEYLVKKGTHDNPSLFMELYGEMREWAREVEHRKLRRKHARPGVQAHAAHAPAGAREAELKALVAKVKSGRAEEGDLLRYIELTMRRQPGEAEGAGGW